MKPNKPIENVDPLQVLTNSRIDASHWLIALFFFLFSAVGHAQINDYRVGSGDRLNIQVYGEPDLSFNSLAIPENGVLDFPLVGDLQVLGKTVLAIESELTRKLKDGYLVNPQVTISVSEFRPVYIIGEVNNPGRQFYTNDLTVWKAIVLAGGLSDRGDKDKIAIERSGSAGKLLNVSEATRIFPGDILTIGARDSFTIRGMVASPGSYFITKDLTVERGITLAGGLNSDADINDVVLDRQGELFDIAEQLSDVLLVKGDIITIGMLNKQEIEIAKQYVYLKGEVSRTGRIEYVEGMNVEKAIVIAGGFSSRASKRKISISREGDPPIQLKRVDLNQQVLPGDVITVGVSFF